MAKKEVTGSRSENFLEKNQKIIVSAITAIVALVVVYFLYYNLIRKPRVSEAANAIYVAEMQFERDSFENALLGPGAGNMGFLDIIDEYKGTPSANLAKYYAGISYLKLGKYEAAISYLKDFKASGQITPITKLGAIGDAYSELEEFDQAVKYYKRATEAGENSFLTPYYLKKLGMLLEHQGKEKEALAAFRKIKNEYQGSPDAFNIDKYIDNLEYSQGLN